mmetsp:Transcript_2201/g.2965  ORF Transcript_2201/g.2965 Transcript_2201/m.2965 type:complete len:88 (+) Transcript_2201:90-353(+)
MCCTIILNKNSGKKKLLSLKKKAHPKPRSNGWYQHKLRYQFYKYIKQKCNKILLQKLEKSIETRVNFVPSMFFKNILNSRRNCRFFF